jgi:Anti-sigma-28 factor, FlgM
MRRAGCLGPREDGKSRLEDTLARKQAARSDPVRELRESIARGDYRVDSSLVAESMVDKALVIKRVRRHLDANGRSHRPFVPRR